VGKDGEFETMHAYISLYFFSFLSSKEILSDCDNTQAYLVSFYHTQRDGQRSGYCLSACVSHTLVLSKICAEAEETVKHRASNLTPHKHIAALL
jgi:hypothetical protein